MDRQCQPNMNGLRYAWIITYSISILVTNPSLIPSKPTRIEGRYFLYRHGTKCTHVRKGLKVNEGEDW
jgi:hypothetical protein